MYIIEPGGFSKEYIKNIAIRAPNKWEDFDWFDNSASQMPDKKPKINNTNGINIAPNIQ